MKDPERVAELLAELRALSESDFERHRLDVLERDLSAPPTVEVIDNTHQRFDGLIYAKDKKGHYHHNTTIHRAVWQYYRGEIPAGYEIHHCNEIKDDNQIENFQMMTSSQHTKLHWDNSHPKKRVCKYCGEEYLSRARGVSLFCSNLCADKWNYEHEQEDRLCPVCGKIFRIWKHAKTVCCSSSCGAKMHFIRTPQPKATATCQICGNTFIKTHKNQRYCSCKCAAQSKKKKRHPRICPVCGKSFMTKFPSSRQLCCSHSCAAKFIQQKRKQAKGKD